MRDEERRTRRDLGTGGRTAQPKPSEHRDSLERAGHQHPAAGSLLALQNRAGNSAVARTLGNRRPAVQRVKVKPKGGESVETSKLTPQQRVQLAAQLLRHKQAGPLGRLRAAHPSEADALSDQELRRIMPRYREVHAESDGESENEDPNTLYRTLRENENPHKDGFRPPEGHDPNITADRHIRSGTQDEVKSAWVSFTRSFKVAAAWAAKDGCRIAKVQLPASATTKEGEFYDTTNPEDLRKVFGKNGGMAQNNAKASQEVVVKGGLGPENLLALFKAEYIDDPAEYARLKATKGTGNNYAVVTTRALAKDQPRRIALKNHVTEPPAAGPANPAASPANTDPSKKRKRRDDSPDGHAARPRAAAF